MVVLFLAVRIEQCAAELRRENLGGDEKMKLFEKIGDFASNLGANELALKMYQSMVSMYIYYVPCRTDAV